MILDNLAVVIPPKQTDAHNAYETPVRHGGRKLLLVRHGLDVVERGLPLPSSKVLVAVDGARGDLQIFTGREDVGIQRVHAGLAEI